jgi:hypothetical protein
MCYLSPRACVCTLNRFEAEADRAGDAERAARGRSSHSKRVQRALGWRPGGEKGTQGACTRVYTFTHTVHVCTLCSVCHLSCSCSFVLFHPTHHTTLPTSPCAGRSRDAREGRQSASAIAARHGARAVPCALLPQGAPSPRGQEEEEGGQEEEDKKMITNTRAHCARRGTSIYV